MVHLDLKNEVLKATSLEDFRSRIRGSVFREGQYKNTPVFSIKTWMNGLELLREAHEMNLVYGALEQYTNDKEKLDTCLEILDSLENFCSVNDENNENRIEYINQIQSSIWNNVTNLHLARQLMAVMNQNAEGHTIRYKTIECDEVLKENITKGSGYRLFLEVITATETFDVHLQVNVPFKEFVHLPIAEQQHALTGVNADLHLKNDVVGEESRKLYDDYLNQFPFDTHVDIQRKIKDFSSVVQTAIASEICSLYMANEGELREEDKNRMVELLFAIAIASRFGQY